MAEEARRSNTSTREVFHVPSNPPLEISEEELRHRLQRMYAKYSPSRAYKLNAVLQRALETGQEGRLLTAMVEKYGPEPNPDEHLDLSAVNALTQPEVQESRELVSAPLNPTQPGSETVAVLEPVEALAQPTRADMDNFPKPVLEPSSTLNSHANLDPSTETTPSLALNSTAGSASSLNLGTSIAFKEECLTMRKEIAALERELSMFLPSTIEELPDSTVALQQQRNLNMLVAMVCLRAQRTEEEKELEVLSHKFQEMTNQLLHC
jgi:hypothetical protein